MFPMLLLANHVNSEVCYSEQLSRFFLIFIFEIKIILLYIVDASDAGEGQLEISINEGEVPNHVTVVGGGRCLVSFTPEHVKPHMIDIKFNSETVIGKQNNLINCKLLNIKLASIQNFNTPLLFV